MPDDTISQKSHLPQPTASVEPMSFRQAALINVIQQLDPCEEYTMTIVCRGNNPWNADVSVSNSDLHLGSYKLSREERWLQEENPLDIWDKIQLYSARNEFPDQADSYRMKYHGLFNLGPQHKTFMLRVRIPGNTLSADQLLGLAKIASRNGCGSVDLTSRGNVQIRGLEPKSCLDSLIMLNDVGLTSRGAGADNVRNVTASPISGIDQHELCDVRPLARALHHHIMNNRELFGLPRKFNVAFDNGGSASVAVTTNDIGIVPVRLNDGDHPDLPAGIYFRYLLAGVPSHGALAQDAGILVKEDEVLAVTVAMIRAYDEFGDRSDRRRARLKYLLEDWGVERFIQAAEEIAGTPFRRAARSIGRRNTQRPDQGHVGFHPQKQVGLYYVGIVPPVGRLSVQQLETLAHLAKTYGDGELRLTIWQSVILPGLPAANLPAVRQHLVAAGLDFDAANARVGILACTGSAGCSRAYTDTKRHALALAVTLQREVPLERPVSINVTGCKNSCVRHAVADIGLKGVHLPTGGEGYDVTIGGSDLDDGGLGRECFTAVPANQLETLVLNLVRHYRDYRTPQQSFGDFYADTPDDQIRAIAAKSPQETVPTHA